MDRQQVLARLRERIVAFAASRISGDRAEDLAQEVLLVLHEKYGHLNTGEDLLPVAFQILRFKMMALRRKDVRHGEPSRASVDELPLADPKCNPEADYARQELMGRLARALQSLGERCRELFRMKLNGRSYEEIRVALGVRSINTIYTWDFRCRRQLLESLGGRWELGQ